MLMEEALVRTGHRTIKLLRRCLQCRMQGVMGKVGDTYRRKARTVERRRRRRRQMLVVTQEVPQIARESTHLQHSLAMPTKVRVVRRDTTAAIHTHGQAQLRDMAKAVTTTQRALLSIRRDKA